MQIDNRKTYFRTIVHRAGTLAFTLHAYLRNHPDNRQETPFDLKNFIERNGGNPLLQEISFRWKPKSFLAPWRKIAENLTFWNHSLDGPGLYSPAQRTAELAKLPVAVDELSIAAE